MSLCRAYNLMVAFLIFPQLTFQAKGVLIHVNWLINAAVLHAFSVNISSGSLAL